ncbi:MAG TPA: NAD-dependent epimerase/dehydratase family protein [Chloroflexota bacterium]|nr:NAD-dependent epimerase/dehydratase family protein [Chloroflexota bacterium]
MAAYFLTGATGFVGGVPARQLREAGHEVTAVVRSPTRATELEHLGARLAEGDVTNKESLRAPMEGVDGVFHVAGWYRIGVRTVEEIRTAHAVNVEGTRNVLEVMRELGIPKGVYTSTLAVFSDTRGRLADETWRHDGPHLSVYDETKWRAHYEVAEPMMRGGLPLVIVQPGLVYGPGDTSSLRRTLHQYLRGRLPMVPKGTAYSWGHVEDTVRGHVLAMEKGRAGESYVICGPSHTLVEAFAQAEVVTGVPAPRIQAPAGVLRALSAAMGAVERVATLPLPETFSAEGLRVVARVTYLGNSAKARRELGFSARPLDDGLRETLLQEMRLLGMRRMAPA